MDIPVIPKQKLTYELLEQLHRELSSMHVSLSVNEHGEYVELPVDVGVVAVLVEFASQHYAEFMEFVKNETPELRDKLLRDAFVFSPSLARRVRQTLAKKK